MMWTFYNENRESGELDRKLVDMLFYYVDRSSYFKLKPMKSHHVKHPKVDRPKIHTESGTSSSTANTQRGVAPAQ